MTEALATKFYFGSHSAMLFALFLDNNEITHLTESVKDVAQSIIGGRNSVQFGPELALLSRTIYYTCSLLSFGRTPGQSFCDFTLVKSSNSELGKEVARKTTNKDLIAASILYSAFPYVYQRKDVICKSISDMYEIIVAPEILSRDPTAPVEEGANTSSTSSELNPSAESPGEPAVNEVPADSFLSKFLRALRVSVASIAATNSDRIEIIFSFMADVHRYLFLHYGRYFYLLKLICSS